MMTSIYSRSHPVTGEVLFVWRSRWPGGGSPNALVIEALGGLKGVVNLLEKVPDECAHSRVLWWIHELRPSCSKLYRPLVNKPAPKPDSLAHETRVEIKLRVPRSVLVFLEMEDPGLYVARLIRKDIE